MIRTIMEKTVTVLLISDNTRVFSNIKNILLKSANPKFAIKTGDSLKTAIEILFNECIECIEFIFFIYTGTEHINFQTLKTITRGYPRIPVIVISSKGEPGIVNKAIENGAQEIIEYDSVTIESIKRYMDFAVERKKRETFLGQVKKEMEQNSTDLKNALYEIKALRAEAKKKNEELEELNQLKSDFVSIVSHELRAPLTDIKEGISRVLEGLHGEINKDQKESLGTSSKGVNRLSEIVNNLLDIANIKTGKIELRKDFTDIGELVKRVTDGFKRIYIKKNLELNVVLTEEKIILFIDSEKIIQVLNNLLSNAFKFTKKGGATVEVKKKEKAVEVSVIDTGTGMNKQSIAGIFNTVTQISRKNEAGINGAEVGLGIAKALVEQHNGSIHVTSTPGKGSTFCFTIPLLSTQVIVNELIKDYVLEARNKDTAFSIMILSLAHPVNWNLEKHHADLHTIFHEIEKIMKFCLRRNADRLLRVKETECIIFLPETGYTGAIALKLRFEDKIRSYLETCEYLYRLHLPIKLGFAGFPVDADTGDALVAKARDNMTELYLGDERRQVKRLPIDVLIKGINDKGEDVEFQTTNISTGGLCISTPNYIEIPERNNIILYLPRDFGTVNTRTVVLWTKNNENVDEYQIGLRFQNLSEKDTRILDRFIDFYKEKT